MHNYKIQLTTQWTYETDVGMKNNINMNNREQNGNRNKAVQMYI